MSFDAAQFLRNPIRMDRADLMMPQIGAEAAPAVAEKGLLGGMQVTVVADPAAELQDSMEELAMQFEEKTARKMGERRLGEARGRPSAYVNALESWMKTLPDMPGREEVEKFLRQLRQDGQEGRLPDLGEFKDQLARLSGDPSHQFAMLDVMDQALGPEETELRALLASARAGLLAEKGGEIRAGVNLATEVNARATTPEEMSDLRNLYRSEILGFTSPQDCFRSILAARGAGALASAIEFLRAGCGADLACDEPSRDPVALRRILTDLQCVQVLQTVLDTMSSLGARMAKEFGLALQRDGEAMTGKIVSFTEKSHVQADELAAFERECGVTPLLARMDFARELLGIFRRLSSRLFELEDDRLRLIEAAEEHLDGIISEENEAEEEEEAEQ